MAALGRRGPRDVVPLVDEGGVGLQVPFAGVLTPQGVGSPEVGGMVGGRAERYRVR